MGPKVVCVVGPTACGKTTLGVLLAAGTSTVISIALGQGELKRARNYFNQNLAVTAAEKLLGREQVGEQELSLGAEDFAEYLAVSPVTYMNIGSRNEALGITAPHHHGEFDIDEACLPVCMGMYVQFVYEFLI